MLFILLLAADPGSGIGGLLCCAVVVGVPLYMLWHTNNQKQIRLREWQEKLEQAERAYRNALRELKRNPANPELKQQALNLGRNYSAMCRENRSATIYDEMAIMNDISAATAGATMHPQAAQHQAAQPQPVTVTNQLSIEDRLAKLNDLKNKGLIDENEYQQRRQKLLDEV